jgi:hypothetical protein
MMGINTKKGEEKSEVRRVKTRESGAAEANVCCRIRYHVGNVRDKITVRTGVSKGQKSRQKEKCQPECTMPRPSVGGFFQEDGSANSLPWGSSRLYRAGVHVACELRHAGFDASDAGFDCWFGPLTLGRSMGKKKKKGYD